MPPQNDSPHNDQRSARFTSWSKWALKPSDPDATTSAFRQRWWRALLLSAVVQGILLLIAWYAVQTRQHSERSISNEHIATVTTVQSTPTETQTTPTIAPNNPSNTSSKNEPATSNSTPRSTTQHTLPTNDLGAQTVRPRDKIPTPNQVPATTPTEQLTTQTTNSTSTNSKPSVTSTPSSSSSNPAPANNLLNVPIATKSLSYRVQLSDGSNTTELPPARLISTHLGAQRYSTSLSNGTTQAGTGNFGWFDTFQMTEHGPNPLEIGGGLYLKTGESPVRLALGLNLHDDGQTWHWGKKANSGARTHTYFLDRVSLITYVQGALNRNPIRGAVQWMVPLASNHAVRDVAVSVSPVSAPVISPDVAIHCQPCVQAQVRAHLGEMNYWSVWYDGAHNWRPVMMRMRLAHPQGQTLILTLQ